MESDMTNYKNIMMFLNDLEAKERRKHECQVQRAKLKSMLAKGLLFAQAGCPDQAAKYQHRAEQILQRLQP